MWIEIAKDGNNTTKATLMRTAWAINAEFKLEVVVPPVAVCGVEAVLNPANGFDAFTVAILACAMLTVCTPWESCSVKLYDTSLESIAGPFFSAQIQLLEVPDGSREPPVH
jgi:hypothetical protein